MSTTTPVSTGPRPAAQQRGPTSRVRGGPRRSVPHLLLGILLVTSCTAGAMVWSLNIGERRPALALARPVALGRAITPADLREVAVALDGGVDAIPASEARSVIGQTVAANLPAGVLLPRAALGRAPVPADDHAIAALDLQPGQAPPVLNAGAHVLVVRSTDPAAGPTAADPDGASSTPGHTEPASVWPGVVVDVADGVDGTNDHGVVVSVELAEQDARRVAAAPVGQLSVVLVPGGDR